MKKFLTSKCYTYFYFEILPIFILPTHAHKFFILASKFSEKLLLLTKHYLIYRLICTPFYILSCTVYGLLSEALKLSSSWKSGKTKAHIFTAPILNC